jgi:hypothetical protein
MSVIPLHTRVERVLESGDMRLVYGVGIPFLLVIAGIVAAAVAQSMWLVAPLMIVVIALTAVVMIGFAQMLAEDEDEPQPR